jgi:SNF2 family DNA or RNA helicase
VLACASRGQGRGVFALTAGLSLSSGRSLRFVKRFRVVPSPLIALRWWRAVLDEAQAVDSPATAIARMAQRLSSVHVLAVSGTPLAHTLSDLQGLLLFLRYPIFDNKAVETFTEYGLLVANSSDRVEI